MLGEFQKNRTELNKTAHRKMRTLTSLYDCLFLVLTLRLSRSRRHPGSRCEVPSLLLAVKLFLVAGRFEVGDVCMYLLR